MRNFPHLATAVALCAASVSVIASPIISLDTRIAGVTATLIDNETDFSLQIIGGEVREDASNTLSGGTYWPILLSITLKENPGTGQHDLVAVTGNVHHEFRPHAGEGPGPILNFGYTLFQGDPNITFNGSTSRIDAFTPLKHDSHFDYYSGTANASFFGTSADREILGWSVTLQGMHRVPEPKIQLLLLAGLCALGISITRQRS